MKNRAGRAVWALVCAVALGALLVPGCVLKLGKGDPGETEAGEGGGSTGTGAEEAPFEDADPVAVARAGLVTSAAAYLLQGAVDQAVELQGLDPESLDQATVEKLIGDGWPVAVDQAQEWVSTLDSSYFEAAVTPNPQYCSSLGCPSKVVCDSEYYKKPITCELQACGDASCKACPDWFGPLKHLVITAWCSYVCVEGGVVVGSVAYVITRFVDFKLPLLP
ncbi:MAG: hypothetical protein R3B70_44070 [Polyangiaceae bacterium]